jgi:type IV fimbrial biogenesis protein FimT
MDEKFRGLFSKKCFRMPVFGKRVNGSSGFSMLELMITLAIIAIMSGVALPNFLAYIPKSRLNGAARMVMVDLMSARMKAVKSNKRTQVHFIGGNQYRINDDADGNGTVDNPEGDAILRDVQDNYPDVSLSANNDPVFFPRGTASPTMSVDLSNGSGSKTVTISIAGRVKIS